MSMDPNSQAETQAFSRKTVTRDGLPSFMQWVRRDCAESAALAFLCIGSDRSTGDSLGPIVGTMLAESGYGAVIGTLEHPCDASNLKERLNELPAGCKVIAIDACLGHPSSVGRYQVSKGPIEPGGSMGKGLPLVGDYGIAAVVAEGGPKPYFALQTVSLHRVLLMARTVAEALMDGFPLREQAAGRINRNRQSQQLFITKDV